MSYCDFGETKIKELEKEIEQLKHVAENLVNIAFGKPDIRNHWRKEFNSPIETVDNGDMP